MVENENNKNQEYLKPSCKLLKDFYFGLLNRFGHCLNKWAQKLQRTNFFSSFSFNIFFKLVMNL